MPCVFPMSKLNFEETWMIVPANNATKSCITVDFWASEWSFFGPLSGPIAFKAISESFAEPRSEIGQHGKMWNCCKLSIDYLNSKPDQ